MTTQERLAKQRKHHQYKYARKLVYADNKELQMASFKHFAGLYGKEWADSIWSLCREISEDRKR